MELKIFQKIKVLLEINFLIAVMVLLAGCFLCISENESFFTFNEDLYGALDNNLRMIMVYLGVTEIAILIYCYARKNVKVLIPVGFFLVLMTVTMDFYGEINTVEIDSNFQWFFIYTGLSHVLVGMASDLAQKQPVAPNKTLH